MGRQSHFGVEISGNRRKYHEFSLAARAAMLAKLDEGKSQRQIAKEFHTTHKTVGSIKRRWDELGTAARARRSGRPEILSKVEKRYIIRLAKKDRKIAWDAIRAESGGRVSRRMIRRVVHTFFKRKWKALDRPRLTPERAKARLQWCKVWIHHIDKLIRVRGVEVIPKYTLIPHLGNVL